MAAKTANVTARIQPDIKEKAEEILKKLGIPVSVFIDMTYRQIILHDGVPFSLDIPKTISTRDTMSETEFNKIMETGLEQAMSDYSISVSEAFNKLRSEI